MDNNIYDKKLEKKNKKTRSEYIVAEYIEA